MLCSETNPGFSLKGMIAVHGSTEKLFSQGSCELSARVCVQEAVNCGCGSVMMWGGGIAETFRTT